MDNSTANNHALLLAVRKDVPEAFTTLTEQYRPLILSMAESFLVSMPKDSLALEDLVQEATIALYKAACRYDLEQSKVTFGLYAKICIRNHLVSTLRRQIRFAKKTKPKEPLPGTEGNAVKWESVAEQLSGLLTRYEEQVLALRLQNYSYKEIAERLSADPKSVDNALYRIRRKLRQAREGESQ
jgi:RNA polymerase sporulation-specific sigma factor